MCLKQLPLYIPARFFHHCSLLTRPTASEIQEVACTALLNSLDACRNNFGVQKDRDFLMQRILAASQAEADGVKVIALECLARVAELYYPVLAGYMEMGLFAVSHVTMISFSFALSDLLSRSLCKP